MTPSASAAVLELRLGAGEPARLDYYSKPEAGFGKDWCVVLDYLAAASFPTIFSTVSEFQKALPPRVLVDGDRAPFISDFTDLQNIVLLGLKLLHEVDSATATEARIPQNQQAAPPEAACLEPVLCKERNCRNERPMYCN
ncbi:hypothetical protein MJG53_008800 [Ovis ammon polii x Ovis aries]|uniref:Uncharacterized protein n=1 Tax=Ovis ammon polii x Ovis aries TaxID=2918886 RepID=A0ACB9UY12_9CETA|nr:hypothetical protein MJT46_008433 [Ovis ammon polii x Ovis aries]KAI4582249.1 hypothetical protein MJG53_008800 [Ovis ammon polii x Ovis aries]